MSAIEVIAWTALALFGLLGSALCSGSESAFYWLSRIRLEVRSADPHNRAARILRREISRPERMLSSLLIANNAFNYVGVLGVTRLLAGAGLTETQQIIVNTLLLTPVILVTAESLPKELFRVRAETLAYAIAPLISGIRFVLTATLVLPLVEWFGRAAAGLAGGGDAEPAVDARRRIAMQIHETSAHGVVSPSQAALVERALHLRTMTVRDEMIDWPRVASVPLSWSTRRVREYVAKKPFSCYPLTDAGGRVAGVLWRLDLRIRPDSPLKELMLEPARLRSDTPVLEAVAAVRAAHARVGIVERDGRPIGLVTIKDLAEPLTGELHAW